ncbi:hypothetical protein JZ751_007989 [Albula glossodonta]|uniref:Peroxiredoxin-like 2A n=1 Tax=Albula glossodonta TaxID=121402 RepID=A0A8T2P4H2_9TELE|nr:hypothetical protein JZ751_007989 [Albula glossodonta]
MKMPKDKESVVLASEILTMGVLTQGLGAVFALIDGILRGFTDLFLTTPLRASLPQLEDADLKTLDGDERTFKAKTLWQKSGAVIMAEAAELSSLKPQLDELGVPLYAVVKENIGTEVHDFRPYFAGDIFLDEKKTFLRPTGAQDGRLGVYPSGGVEERSESLAERFLGNIYGEGFVLGAVYVIRPGQQGIALEHREMEFGDKVNILDVLRAVKSLPVELVENSSSRLLTFIELWRGRMGTEECHMIR